MNILQVVYQFYLKTEKYVKKCIAHTICFLEK